jgi:hypothetical protein
MLGQRSAVIAGVAIAVGALMMVTGLGFGNLLPPTGKMPTEKFATAEQSAPIVAAHIRGMGGGLPFPSRPIPPATRTVFTQQLAGSVNV